MKSLLLFSLILFAVACGKHNESGKSALPQVQATSPYTAADETAIRNDFIREGQELLRQNENQMKRMFGPRVVGLIRNRLKYDNVQVSERLLYNNYNAYTRSTNRNSMVTLYIGHEEPNLSWGGYRKKHTSIYSRLVMHELLLLGEVNDDDFYYTDRILNVGPRRR